MKLKTPQELTPRQAEVRRAILAHVARHGTPPTVRDLMPVLEVESPNGVVCHLKALTAKGHLVGYGTNAARSFLPPELLAAVKAAAAGLLKNGEG